MAPLNYVHENPCCAACNGNQDLHKERTACRYYQAGNCRRGSNCPFAHTSQIEPPTISPAAYSGENVYTFYPPGQTPVYLPLSSSAQPVFLWQQYPPASSSFDPRYGLVCQTENLPDYPDDKSDRSSAESSSTPTSMDYQHRLTLDTAWLEAIDLGTLRGVAGPPSDIGSNLSPGHTSYPFPAFSGVRRVCVGGGDHATSGQGSAVAFPSPFLLPWQDDSKKKPLTYKTKPCKFYAANGRCTSGERCTFIHDPEPKGNARKASPKLTPPTYAKLPPRPIDKYDDYRARDFYPITWRVIGGGVMMGGKRQICPAFAAGQCRYGNDCKLAHETELETDEVGYIEPKSEPGGKGSVQTSPQQPEPTGKGTPPKRVRPSVQRKSVKVPPVPAETAQAVAFPSATPRSRRPRLPALETAWKKGESKGAISSAPASPVHRRTQSMSMAVTSPSSVDTTHSNCAAEL